MIKALVILIVLIIGLILGFKSKLRSKSNESKLKDFKSKADKVKIDLTQASIKTNKWTDEIVTDNSNYAGLNQLTGNSERNIDKIDRTVNSVNVEFKYKGETINHTTNVLMDSDNLKIHLAIQKETILYIDSENYENRYLDLEFIDR